MYKGPPLFIKDHKKIRVIHCSTASYLVHSVFLSYYRCTGSYSSNRYRFLSGDDGGSMSDWDPGDRGLKS